MPSGRRILFLSINYSRPAGGVKTVYRHAEILRQKGFDATVLHAGGSDALFFDTSASVIRVANGFKFHPDDILVVNEDRRECLDFAASINLEKVLFLQNQFFMFEGLGDGRNYRDVGINHYLTGSRWMARIMTELVGVPDVPVIRYAIDTGRFFPENKERSIAFMPRKNPLAANFIRRGFTEKFPEHNDVSWNVIDGLSEDDAAQILRKSAIFLSLSRFEGLGLPPLEAMSSGCLCVGFPGDGGKEYMTESNGFWVEQEDLMGAINSLDKAIRTLDEMNHLQKYLDAGAETAAYYSVEGMEQDLLAFWDIAAI